MPAAGRGRRRRPAPVVGTLRASDDASWPRRPSTQAPRRPCCCRRPAPSMTPSAPCARSTPRPVAGCRSSCTSAAHWRWSPTISAGLRNSRCSSGSRMRSATCGGSGASVRRSVAAHLGRRVGGPVPRVLGVRRRRGLAGVAGVRAVVRPAVWDALTPATARSCPAPAAVRVAGHRPAPVPPEHRHHGGPRVRREFGLEVGEARPPAEPLTASERGQVRGLANILRAEEATTGMRAQPSPGDRAAGPARVVAPLPKRAGRAGGVAGPVSARTLDHSRASAGGGHTKAQA